MQFHAMALHQEAGQRQVQRRHHPGVHAAHQEARQQRARLRAQQRFQRQPFHGATGVHLQKLPRLAHMPAHEVRDHAHTAAEHERQSPRPVHGVLAAEDRLQRHRHALTKQQPRVHACHQQRRHQRHAPRPRVLAQPAQRCGNLAAQRHALQQSKAHQQHRCRYTKRGVARQQRDHQRACGHAQHRVREHVGAPATIAHMRPQHAANRARQIPDREHREGLQRAAAFTRFRRKERATDLRREHREDDEVVELEHATKRADGGGAHDGALGVGCGGHRGSIACASRGRMGLTAPGPPPCAPCR